MLSDKTSMSIGRSQNTNAASILQRVGARSFTHTGTREVHKGAVVGAISIHFDLHLGGFQIQVGPATVMHHFQSLHTHPLAVSMGPKRTSCKHDIDDIM